MRPIDADELKKDLTRFYDNEVTAKQLIDEQPTIEPEQRWTPCSERLPEIDKDVLVTDGESCLVCSLFESPDIEDGLYQWEDDYGHWHEFETWVAWMPLPEPYKGEQVRRNESIKSNYLSVQRTRY